jgi:hypothetical protein
MNSPEVVADYAARKIGATAVPPTGLPREAAYVVDDSDAVFVWADAERAELFAEIRSRIPKVREVAVYAGAARTGQLGAGRWLEDGNGAEPELPPAKARQHMIYKLRHYRPI